jgi:hypothetical protein
LVVSLGAPLAVDAAEPANTSTERPLGPIRIRAKAPEPEVEDADRRHLLGHPFFHFYPYHRRRRHYRSYAHQFGHHLPLWRPPAYGHGLVYSWRYRHYAYPYGHTPPYGATYDRYRTYVVLGTPTARPEAGRQWGTFVPPGLRREQGVEGRALEFRSDLSPMLGGPSRVDAAFALGEARLRSGDFPEAVEAFQYSFRADPGHPPARIALALALIGAGNYEGAVHMLRTGLAGLRSWDDLQLDLDGLAADPGTWERTAGKLKEAAAGEPEDRGLALLLAFVQFGRGRYAASARLLSELKERKPTDEVVTGMLLAAEGRIGVGNGPEDRAEEGEDEPSEPEPEDVAPQPSAGGEPAPAAGS